MADRTELNGEQLAQMMKKFQSEAEELNQMLGQTRNKIGTLRSSGWIGRGSDQFYNEMESMVLPAVQRLVEALNAASNQVNAIMKIYDDASNQSQSYFKLE